MNWGRFGRNIATWGSNALPKFQQFGRASGNFLHNAASTVSKIAQNARLGLNAIENSELGRIPGAGEALGFGRDVLNGLSAGARVAGQVGNFASGVGASKELRGLTSQFERLANS